MGERLRKRYVFSSGWILENIGKECNLLRQKCIVFGCFESYTLQITTVRRATNFVGETIKVGFLLCASMRSNSIYDALMRVNVRQRVMNFK